MLVISRMAGIIFVVIVLLSLLSACGSNDDKQSPPPSPNPTSPLIDSPITQATSKPTSVPTPAKDVVITIGNLTDKTGPGAIAFALIDMALDDLVAYYNDNNLIPGVKLEVVSYDGAFDPAKDIPGYEWLKDRGADVIFTAVPTASVTLTPRANNDHFMMFALAPSIDMVDPPGYVFSPGTMLVEHQIYSILNWIAENDPNFPQDRPTKIGGAMWTMPYTEAILRGAEEYADAHPEQYDWVAGHLTNFAFTWDPEVADLKDCDYVIPPTLMQNLVQEYRDSGYTAQFIGCGIHTSFFGKIDQGDYWDEVNGMRILMPHRWWNEDDENIDLFKQILMENHPDDADEIMRTSNGYLGADGIYIMLQLIAATVESVGPEHFSSEALYNTTTSFSLESDGVVLDSFSDTKRLSRNYFGMYELRADEQDLFRVDEEWLPVVEAP